MATGLERILEQIRADAEQKAGETVAAAEREAEALLEKAAQAAEQGKLPVLEVGS